VIFRLLFLLGLTLATAAAAAELSIVRVYTGWRDAASFKRIAEYFDGKEHAGREVVLRSHPDQRAGYYFLVRLKNSGAALKANVHLQLIRPDRTEARTTIFPVEVPAGSTAFQLGLTGPEWQDAKVQAIAWHLQVIAEGGQVLATDKSYLWEKPAAK
jgi:hypothetical protein